MNGDIGLVFIHGAGLGGWIWQRMAEAVTYPHVLADFPQRDGTAGARSALTLDDYTAEVVAQAGDLGTDRVVVIAHSLGGVVGLKVAELLGDRLAGFIAVSAAVPRDGGSFVSALPIPKRWIVGGLMRLAGTKPPESAIRQGLCSDLDQEMADRVVDRFVQESKAVYFGRAEAASPDVPRAYVVLTEDREFDPGMQRSMARNLGADDTPTIAAGHLAMISKPDELASVINDFTAKVS